MSTAVTETPPLAAQIRRHAVDLIRLAVPVMVARAGMMTMVVVDTLVVGQYGSSDLAWLGLASAAQSTMFAVLVGLLLGTVVMTAQAVGAGDRVATGRIWRQSLSYALLVGLICTALSFLGEPFFLLTGQSAELAAGGGRLMEVYGYGMVGGALFATTTLFLEGLKRPLPGMVAIVIANLVNLGLDWVLVFGLFGLPELGAEGSAWATTLIRWGMAAGLIAYVWWMPDQQAHGVRQAGGGWRAGAEQRRLGYAAGASNGLEASAFATLTLFAGWMGPLALAAYTVGLNLIALPFMSALGLAAATAVRVGNAHGAKDRRETALAGWTGLGVTTLLLGLTALAFALFPAEIARGFAADPALIAVIIPVVGFSAWILVADGGQVVMAQALRGRGDTWMPTVLHFFSYFAVMVPLCWFLGIRADRGVMGLFEGIFVASVISVGVLSARFAWLSRR
ncbi:MATE family efflux transporter [Rhodocista pekingensis]|uniref:MATE family efflux transporter n=1 Tax=Rhodocista pekingensis TaxID=201185 RepID=A0ABW2KRG9_9PROT